ncbi:hypothetical protein GH714_032206 [Hevea brasiliensis]|uniref:Uncharacterized protein n=1 Tax=Hevea brasiliensis TaxID=3981 RepID=A0A6A6L450_HEVBR|nr:hypothetical protein GH714_032206 [Hevea brasiliensis]
MAVVLVYSFCCTLLWAIVLRAIKRRIQEKKRANLPPGSMGLPYIGETLQLYAQNPDIFFAARRKRYGEIFKTCILGCPCVMVASPEAIRSLVPHIETIAISALESWSSTSGKVVNTFYEMKKVIMESLRMASIISFTFREAIQDVEYKGFLIPKGWKVLPLFRNIHHNPDYFTDPHVFNPSRFEVRPKPNTFMPFGNGVHACPGNEVAKLEILILIHHLVTKFRWEVVGSANGVQYDPFPVPQQGLQAKFWKESTSCTAGHDI